MAKNAMMFAISSARATLLSGVLLNTSCIFVSFRSKPSVNGVSVNQGDTAFTLMPDFNAGVRMHQLLDSIKKDDQ